MSFPYHIVEYETNERPGDKVHGSCWRYLACASQHHRDAERPRRIPSKRLIIKNLLDIFEKTCRPSPIYKPPDEWCQSTHQEEICETCQTLLGLDGRLPLTETDHYKVISDYVKNAGTLRTDIFVRERTAA